LQVHGFSSKEQIIGKNSLMFIAKKDHKRAMDNLKKTLGQGLVKNVEYTLLTKDGKEFPGELSASVIKDISGKPIAFVALTKDITERKYADEKIQNLAKFPSQNPYPVLRIAKNGILLYANEPSGILLGDWDCQVGQPVPDNVREIVADILESGEKKNIEFEHKQQIFLFSIAPVIDIGYVNLYGIDITERKRAEEQIKQSLKEKEVLLKEIHHRVKNNMQIISSLLSLQSRYVKGKKALEMFQNSQARIRAMALVHEKLYRSKDLARINFVEYVQDIVRQLFRSHGISPATISYNIRVKDVFLAINRAIPCSLIINELVSNSLKHAFPASVKTTADRPDGKKGKIDIDFYLGKDNKLLLKIRDNGIGLPDNIDFKNTKTLGLQLVTTLVEQLNGTIEVDIKRGTTFKIKFDKSEGK
jgi:PAS domain S-box-containing protein